MDDGSPLIILAPCPEQGKGGLRLPFQPLNLTTERQLATTKALGFRFMEQCDGDSLCNPLKRDQEPNK